MMRRRVPANAEGTTVACSTIEGGVAGQFLSGLATALDQAVAARVSEPYARRGLLMGR
jgi:hypothetical protein